MTTKQLSNWEAQRTDESRMIEDKLHEAGLERVDAYRYNSASLRVRVIDRQFESIPREERVSIVEAFIDELPLATQADIITLVLLAPSELEQPSEISHGFTLNAEFENQPSLHGGNDER